MRDEAGSIKDGFGRRIASGTSFFLAKALMIREACIFCLKAGIAEACIESDKSSIVTWCINEDDDSSLGNQFGDQ